MTDQNLENLEMLVTVSRLLSSKLELSDLLSYTMKLAARVVNAERASLYLVDERTNELYFDVALGLPEEVQKLRLKPGEGIAGLCYKDGRSTIINDVSQDAQHSRRVDSESGFVTRSVLTCPMVVKGSVIGVVQAINRLDGDFSDRDLKNFEAFASQAAVAIENARLFSAVKEEKRRLQIFFTETTEAAVMMDSCGTVLLSNDAAKAYLGGGMESGTKVSDLFRDMELAPSPQALLASKERSSPFTAVREKPKKLYLEGTAIRLEKKSAAKDSCEADGWLLLFRDVTESRRETALARNFLSLVSHKLKTPLTVISGYVDLLSEEAKKGAIQGFSATAVETIARQENRLSGLVEQLLNYTTIEELDPAALKLTAVQLDDAVAEAAKLCARESDNFRVTAEQAGLVLIQHGPAAGPAEVSLSYSFPTVPELRADAELFKGLLAALISNAVKFNGKNQRSVKITAERDGCAVLLSVSDDGPGIPPEEHTKIFNKFYQVEASFTGQVEGWGLGLAYVKKVMEAHGGSVRLRSGENGSTFTCVFNS